MPALVGENFSTRWLPSLHVLDVEPGCMCPVWLNVQGQWPVFQMRQDVTGDVVIVLDQRCLWHSGPYVPVHVRKRDITIIKLQHFGVNSPHTFKHTPVAV